MMESNWQSLQQSADRARKSADHEKAVELYLQALTQPGTPWEATVDMTMACAYCYQMLGQFTRVDACLTGLVEKASQLGDDAVVVKAYAELIFILRRTGDLKRGL